MKFGDVLRELLEQHSLSQKGLAKSLNIAPTTLGNYIHNTREPDFKTLLRIAEYFEVTTDYLLHHTVHSALSHEEELLLHIFRALSPEQKEFYLEQGKIFIRQNNKKNSSSSPINNELSSKSS